MIVIGLTGATGAGKGFFGKTAFEKYGIVHIDTDKTAREVVMPGEPCLEDIKDFFGEEVINEDGTLNRKKLGEIVFSDKEKLSVLNRITHHYITDKVKKTIENARSNNEKAVIIDAPLLFESGEDKLCDVTVGVIAHRNIRKSRIMSRDGISEEMAESRIASGKDEGFFREKCDYILENNGNEAEYTNKAILVIEEILKIRLEKL